MDDRIALMYKLHGRAPGYKCADCCNLQTEFYGRAHYKCVAYGTTRPALADWDKGQTACGLYGKPFDPNTMRPAVEAKKHMQRQVDTSPIDGQISITDMGV